MNKIMPLYIVDVIGEIVAAVQAAMLTTIQENETAALGRTTIETVNYQKGHKVELIQTLMEMDRANAYQAKKSPLIYLVQDFTEKRGRKVGEYTEANLNIIIAHQTESTRKVDDRYTKVFKPVLYPLYYELLEQIAKHPLIFQANGDDITHDKTDRLYWGRVAAGGGNDQNKLTDFVDAIEITNLNLKFYFNKCP
jgi:hypothetical protein